MSLQRGPTHHGRCYHAGAESGFLLSDLGSMNELEQEQWVHVQSTETATG